MNLHEYAEDFKVLTRLTAQHMKIREVYVEKDYWVTFLLKRITAAPNNHRVVFKGGTSLSKAYGLIKRFSEDVDLAIIREEAMNNTAVENFIRETSKFRNYSGPSGSATSLKLRQSKLPNSRPVSPNSRPRLPRTAATAANHPVQMA